jgi:hypothetical protein
MRRRDELDFVARILALVYSEHVAASYAVDLFASRPASRSATELKQPEQNRDRGLGLVGLFRLWRRRYRPAPRSQATRSLMRQKRPETRPAMSRVTMACGGNLRCGF